MATRSWWAATLVCAAVLWSLVAPAPCSDFLSSPITTTTGQTKTYTGCTYASIDLIVEAGDDSTIIFDDITVDAGYIRLRGRTSQPTMMTGATIIVKNSDISLGGHAFTAYLEDGHAENIRLLFENSLVETTGANDPGWAGVVQARTANGVTIEAYGSTIRARRNSADDQRCMALTYLGGTGTAIALKAVDSTIEAIASVNVHGVAAMGFTGDSIDSSRMNLNWITVVAHRSTVRAETVVANAAASMGLAVSADITTQGFDVKNCKFWARDSTVIAKGANSADSMAALGVAKNDDSVFVSVSYCEFVAKNTTVKAESGTNADSIAAMGMCFTGTGSQTASHIVFYAEDSTLESKSATSVSDSETMAVLAIAAQRASPTIQNTSFYALSSALTTICHTSTKSVAMVGIAQEDSGTVATTSTSAVAISSTITSCSGHTSSSTSGTSGSVSGSPQTPCCDTIGGGICDSGTTEGCQQSYPPPTFAGSSFIVDVKTPTVVTPTATHVLSTPTRTTLTISPLRLTRTQSTLSRTGDPQATATASTRTASVEPRTTTEKLVSMTFSSNTQSLGLSKTRSSQSRTSLVASRTRSSRTSTREIVTNTPSSPTQTLPFETTTAAAVSLTLSLPRSHSSTSSGSASLVRARSPSATVHRLPSTDTRPFSVSVGSTTTATRPMARTPSHTASESVPLIATPSLVPAISTTKLGSTTPARTSTKSLHVPLLVTATPEISTTATVPRMIPRVTPKPAIPKEVVAEAESAGTGVASVGSAVAMGNPAVAAQGSRLAQLRAALSCGEDSDDGVDAPGRQDNLLGLSLGSAPDEGVRGHVGAVLGNLVVLISAGTLVGGVLSTARHIYIKQRDDVKERSFQRSLAFCRFPGIMLFPTMFLLQPIATSSVVVIGKSSDDPASITLGIFGLLFAFATVTASSVYVIRWLLPRFVNVPWVPEGKGTKEGVMPASGRGEATIAQQNRQRGLFFWFVSPQDEWVPTMAHKDPETASCLMRQFDLVLEPYRNGRAVFVLVELGVSAVGGVVGGLLEVMNCLPPAVMAMCVYLVFCGAMAVLRPYTRPADFALQFTAAFLQFLASLCAVIWQTSKHSGVQSAGNFFVVVAAAIAVVLGVYELVKSVYLQATSDRKRRFAKAVSHALAQNQSHGTVGITGEGTSQLADLLFVDAGMRQPAMERQIDETDNLLDELLAADDNEQQEPPPPLVQEAPQAEAELGDSSAEERAMREAEAKAALRRKASEHVHRITSELEARRVVDGARPLLDSFQSTSRIAFNDGSNDDASEAFDDVDPPRRTSSVLRTVAPQQLTALRRTTSTVVGGAAPSQANDSDDEFFGRATTNTEDVDLDDILSNAPLPSSGSHPHPDPPPLPTDTKQPSRVRPEEYDIL